MFDSPTYVCTCTAESKPMYMHVLVSDQFCQSKLILDVGALNGSYERLTEVELVNLHTQLDREKVRREQNGCHLLGVLHVFLLIQYTCTYSEVNLEELVGHA